MAQRGRKSSAATMVTNEGLPAIKIPDCGKSFIELYFDTIASVKPDHFIQSDAPLLMLYCRTLSMVSSVEDPIEFTRLTRLAAQLAVRLRLCPSARMRPDEAQAPAPRRDWETR